ncbi:hypothetical protein [Streptomyces sp. CC208A]|uniref:hypothetical protein n=1 Tax=Streptomyces sp. CC208A TaxID=3044573 RepID=UPI0024A98AF4|nr:hypothetical protein [Streptomyces sp. CC208A]
MRFPRHRTGRTLAAVALAASPLPLALSLATPAAAASTTLAGAGAATERLWLLGALALVLAATGLVAKAAMRGRQIREDSGRGPYPADR